MLRPSGLLAFSLLLSHAAVAAEPELYETGPSEESAYIRFANALAQDAVVVASNGAKKIQLGSQGANRVTRFYRVKAGARFSTTIRSNGHEVAVQLTGKPWEYITVAAVPDGAAGIKAMPVRETPEDFNAMRASLALFNLDVGCANAAMRGGAKNVPIFGDVKPFTVQRRLINPVKLAANITCNGQPAETLVDIAQMQAGERYSVFLFAPQKRQAVVATDSN